MNLNLYIRCDISIFVYVYDYDFVINSPFYLLFVLFFFSFMFTLCV